MPKKIGTGKQRRAMKKSVKATAKNKKIVRGGMNTRARQKSALKKTGRSSGYAKPYSSVKNVKYKKK